MHCIQVLPETCREILHIDLQHDKKAATVVNLAALLVSAVMAVIGHLFVPFRYFHAPEEGIAAAFLRLLVMIAGMFLYIVLHELTHAAAMKHYRAGKLRFGFTGLYAFAGSEGDYFDKSAYRVIALAPLAVWTLLLTPGLILAPRSWFWVLYFIQIANISGAAGDVYVTLRLHRFPDTIWVRDTGVDMTVYGSETQKAT